MACFPQFLLHTSLSIPAGPALDPVNILFATSRSLLACLLSACMPSDCLTSAFVMPACCLVTSCLSTLCCCLFHPIPSAHAACLLHRRLASATNPLLCIVKCNPSAMHLSAQTHWPTVCFHCWLLSTWCFCLCCLLAPLCCLHCFTPLFSFPCHADGAQPSSCKTNCAHEFRLSYVCTIGLYDDHRLLPAPCSPSFCLPPF
jgi:hypothetical protein